jgi:hypothetical protein
MDHILEYRQTVPRKYYIIILIGFLLFTSIFGCHHILQPQSTQNRVNPDFKFSIAGANANMVETQIPFGNRIDPYKWDKVPNFESRIQMVRACQFFTNTNRNPVNSERLWCWDKHSNTLLHYDKDKSFEKHVKQNPNLIWLIGNEPDIETQDNLKPIEYAIFYGWIAKTITNIIRKNKSQALPKLVLCQSASNPIYCQEVYKHLNQLIKSQYWYDWPKNLTIEDTIRALSVHSYVKNGSLLKEDKLEYAIKKWKNALNRISLWSNAFNNGNLSNKPIWVTEFGVLEGYCPEKLEKRKEVDKIDGVECPTSAKRGNGIVKDDYVFYGRNDREGIWGLQKRQIEYFLNSNGTSDNNQGDFEAAWWFISKQNVLGTGECGNTAWLFGDDLYCGKNQDSPSRSGKLYKKTIKFVLDKAK